VRSPLDNPRFRALLLVGSGVPIALLYLWRTLVLPLLAGVVPGDFKENYMAAAAKIAAGRDPYDLCVIQGCTNSSSIYVPLPLAGAQYVTPPPVAWMLQPLVHASAMTQLIVVLAVLQVSLAVFLWATFRALGVKGWQMVVLLVLVAIAFEPVAANFDEGQVNLVLLGLSGVWLLGWVRGDGWWAGAALGASVAIKLLQAPLGLLVVWGRRWRMLAGAVVAGLALWLVAVPQYLPEFLFKVAPVLTAGTGLFENHSPGGTVMRLFDPATFLGAARDTPAAARVITVLISLAVLAATFWVLRRPADGKTSRALEASAMVAAGPLIASYSWGTHLVLLLPPMLVLLHWAILRRDWTVTALVSGGWLLIGPAHKWMAEFGVVGITAIWIASLLAVRRQRSADRADAANENRAEDEEDDRRAENRPVSGVGRNAVEVVE
jgi:hypothetical protein